MSTSKQIIERDSVVVKFVGDSGDGMQLSGTLFSDAAALAGNDIATFPDYPAEIRAPHNTIAGVSGFQVHIGKETKIIGDKCDVLVAMNPASLKANLKWIDKGATIITDGDAYDEKALEKAGYESNPLTDGSLSSYNVIAPPISTLAQETASQYGMDTKNAARTKNMFCLGMVYYIFNFELNTPGTLIDRRFKKKPEVAEVNKKVLEAGYNFAETIEAFESRFQISNVQLPKGRYRNITGNIATAWGLLAASERSGRDLFLGSYPITPATEILIEIAQHKSLGAKVFQAEDEIAGICSAIGASFAGSLAVTTTSGPGLSLKTEAVGLAVMTELPIVIVDVQRAGPSTGMPTKSEQADLNMALYGRNGEAPCIVIAASSSSDCFYAAYNAAKYALETMTPVILLTDGKIGQGSELFRIPKVADLPAINPPIVQPNDPDFKPYRRDPETLVRGWAIPGTEGLQHRVGGLEKTDIFGAVSTDPLNHEKMINNRYEKVMRLANRIPKQEVTGCVDADTLVVSWGGTKGSIETAVKEVNKSGKKVAHAHFSYIMPLPSNTAEIFARYKKILVCELNTGQFVGYLRATLPDFKYLQYNKVQGLPFTVGELVTVINNTL
ncbi:MAG TPA: 2-oxoacid:acceptor oxidoreductase subunit alpha [Bacteroidales bacterium]|nr:2-oxoacid:acceptor oxidoreductase subunit alpha [Bacteroidales bacterium]HOH22754.1 2-oxoacid:acceptor oxidoreductase subunit alpha [Bacteroidales bacterium]HPB57619.1 2-oxoacid:acceptor oxidoreductase subunit alpha [Bacteroidales bacterium]HPZ03092.1 2-oxoacid:acceptor oxidoreductase subunit alpha [Bacteroidales bacterium]HQB74714.1 2-oxoacid:acceptor oxidoreductase subunit alpha [Bacteroidales bacterium]